MNKLIAGGVITGTLLFGAGAGAMITNTVAEHKVEEVKAEHSEQLATERASAEDKLGLCHEAIRLSEQSLGDLAEYFEASNAYVANLPHPGYQLDSNLAEKTRVIRDVYLNTGWGQEIQDVKIACGYSWE